MKTVPSVGIADTGITMTGCAECAALAVTIAPVRRAIMIRIADGAARVVWRWIFVRIAICVKIALKVTDCIVRNAESVTAIIRMICALTAGNVRSAPLSAPIADGARIVLKVKICTVPSAETAIHFASRAKAAAITA